MTAITTSRTAATAVRSDRRSPWFLLVVVLLLGFLAPTGSDSSVFGATGITTRYVKVAPFRLADTRVNLGAQRLDANTWRVTVAGVNGVPANAAAVAVSLVATGASQPGNLLTYPAGEARPTASNLNYDAGQTYSTGAIVPLGAGGAFDVYTLNPVDFVVDVTGAFVPATTASAGRFVPVAPSRRLDTRTSGWLDPGETATVNLGNGVPTDATAAIVTLTSTAPNSPGYFTAWASGAVPQTSSLNVSDFGSTRATTTIIPIANRSLRVASSNGGHLIVDLIGYFTGPSAPSNAVGLFIPMTPTRQLDTRQQGAFSAGEARSFTTTGGGAAVGSLAMIHPAQPGYGALFANGTADARDLVDQPRPDGDHRQHGGDAHVVGGGGDLLVGRHPLHLRPVRHVHLGAGSRDRSGVAHDACCAEAAAAPDGWLRGVGDPRAGLRRLVRRIHSLPRRLVQLHSRSRRVRGHRPEHSRHRALLQDRGAEVPDR